MGRTQKHRVPRANLSHVWIRNQTARRKRTLPQTCQIPFHPRAFAHTVSSIWNVFSLPNVPHAPTLHQGKAFPNPSQPLPAGQVCSFCDSHSRDPTPSLRLLLLVCNCVLIHVTELCPSLSARLTAPGCQGSVSPA